MANQSIEQVLITKQAMSLYQSKKITIHEALMLSIITALDNEKGCFATNRYFANNLPFEVERVKEIIKSLIKKGYIKSTMIENNTKRVLRIVTKGGEETSQDDIKVIKNNNEDEGINKETKSKNNSSSKTIFTGNYKQTNPKYQMNQRPTSETEEEEIWKLENALHQLRIDHSKKKVSSLLR